jgi:hypothetical protein
MNFHKLFLYALLALSTILFSCSNQPQPEERSEEKVEQVPPQVTPEEQPCPIQNSFYPSYQKAVSEIRNGVYEYSDSQDMSSSSWVSAAEFYSCDEVHGSLIMTTKANRDYINFGVPIDVWKSFKSAASYGSYYSQNLKGKYSLRLAN